MLVVAHMEYHPQNVRAVTLVEIPVISDTNTKFFDLNLFIHIFNVLNNIWRELYPFNDLIQKMLKRRNQFLAMVVLLLRILLTDCGQVEVELGIVILEG